MVLAVGLPIAQHAPQPHVDGVDRHLRHAAVRNGQLRDGAALARHSASADAQLAAEVVEAVDRPVDDLGIGGVDLERGDESAQLSMGADCGSWARRSTGTPSTYWSAIAHSHRPAVARSWRR